MIAKKDEPYKLLYQIIKSEDSYCHPLLTYTMHP